MSRKTQKLIQDLVDGDISPEIFTLELQRIWESGIQPCLPPFLARSLPLLRESLENGDILIDGIRPPPIQID